MIDLSRLIGDFFIINLLLKIGVFKKLGLKTNIVTKRPNIKIAFSFTEHFLRLI
jgi:hypothetical protein